LGSQVDQSGWAAHKSAFVQAFDHTIKRVQIQAGPGGRAELFELLLSIQVFYDQTLTVRDHVHAVLHNIIHHSLDY
jgi:hypothetical protein